jgi:hypothetical protein
MVEFCESSEFQEIASIMLGLDVTSEMPVEHG